MLFPPLLRRYASFFGNPHFYEPRPDFLNWPNWTYFYSVAPLRRTLADLIDFTSLADRDAAPELLVSATDLEDGQIRYFHSREQGLTLDHIIASGSLPPAFPSAMIKDGSKERYYWDGGLFDNTPLGAVLDKLDRGPEVRRTIYVCGLSLQGHRLVCQPDDFGAESFRGRRRQYWDFIHQRRFVNRQCRSPSLFSRREELPRSRSCPRLFFTQRPIFREVSVEVGESRNAETPHIFDRAFEFGPCRRGGHGRGIADKVVEPLKSPGGLLVEIALANRARITGLESLVGVSDARFGRELSRDPVELLPCALSRLRDRLTLEPLLRCEAGRRGLRSVRHPDSHTPHGFAAQPLCDGIGFSRQGVKNVDNSAARGGLGRRVLRESSS